MVEMRSSHSCSVIIPTKNEEGNIAGIFSRVPFIGSDMELIFVDGDSNDGTVSAIIRQIKSHYWYRPKILFQQGTGKWDAVRLGFDHASGDILIILDSDLAVPPEQLPRFYDALVSGRSDFANGYRIPCLMESGAMRLANRVGNRLFALLLGWIIGQKLGDTLCGTKALFRRDYVSMKRDPGFFGDMDPFGDFDLLFGAARLGLRIVDIPVPYHARRYGKIKIHRWRDGQTLLKLCVKGYRGLHG
jgi:glycosyltransferase involved in cell wall biosynthesis